ncbi:MAG: IS1182 family transposase [Acidobacteriaceae bacterium]|nr:IS1182 family transposase [Acidobacteriaceae bacterium]
MGEQERRCIEIDRRQLVMRTIDIETLIDNDHPARTLWQITGELDLSPFYAPIKSLADGPGRSRFDPRLLICVWLYGYSRGIGSARELARQIEIDPALQWLTGLDSINHHTLSDFRVDHKQALDQLFAQVLGVLLHAGLMTLERVTQDGTKIRAARAAMGTFRTDAQIRKDVELARQHVAALDSEQESVGRQAGARIRAARERTDRLERALEEIETLRASKKKDRKRFMPKVSETEPEARVMRNNEGGFAASYNAQISTDAEHGLIVCAALSNDVNDSQQLKPAIERLQAACGRTPKQMLADGDFTTNASVTAAAQAGIDLYGSWSGRQYNPAGGQKALVAAGFQHQDFHYDAERDVYVCPANKLLTHTRNIRHSNGAFQIVYRSPMQQCRACPAHGQCCPGWPKRGGRQVSRQGVLPAVAAFQAKMSTREAQLIYRQRSRIAEFPHAWPKEKFRLRRFHVSGIAKAGIELTWAALTFNLLALHRLHRRPLLAAA